MRFRRHAMSRSNQSPQGRVLARLLVSALLALLSGCATERVARTDSPMPEGASKNQPQTTVSASREHDRTVALASGATAKPAQEQPTGEIDTQRLSEDTRQKDLNAPVPSPTMIPPSASEYPIDLSTALQLAEAENPTIAAARARIMEALAQQTAARAILLPSLNAGTNYHLHTGNLQRSSGTILNTTLQSLYVGGGAMANVAGTVNLPMINIIGTLTEAWFEPLAARQHVIGSTFTALATNNDILLDVALLHLELLANQEILQVQRLSEKQVHQLAVIVTDFAVTGAHRTSDANRAQAEWKLHRAATQRAEEQVAVSAARLANRLNLDPTVRLRPGGATLSPLNLIALDTPNHDLIDYALRNRPDLRARTADVARAEFLYHEELARPWIPFVWLGYSAGGFGGGSNVVPPLFAHFGGRSDFDVAVNWTLLNMGAGNLALQNQGFARVGEADARRVAMINQVRREIISARADALAARQQIEIARKELASAEAGFREDADRSRQDLGRPIEVLNSLNLVAAARVNVIKARLRYNQAQFRLFVALGSPPPLVNSPKDEIAPPPVTTPLRGPIPIHGHPVALGLE
jgi:outer membrane protein TolC